ncbi:3-dehydroquinate synthase [Bythopirellula polymerisocia]|uniref:3-dehydroquinate synthase n=1 Tax=Bythopirellula polymerisocia TaxID=2528003 RepID=A0A5C6CZN4_9BACT|nr:3-dehydroquinate synthase [Bythopirellula polymerisocia]TWU30102.1 3-dehydroquinate synthase [Bythopirellula polymerisocia]
MTQPLLITRVNLDQRSYDIQIGSGNLAALSPFLRDRCQGSHVVIITDDQVDPLYADKLGDQLAEDEWEVHVLVIDAGEQSKSVENAQELWETMLEEGTDRKSIVLAIGGGVVGDLAGFAAASFARGLQFFQVPTTLLAQVDSSVGGKVGINLPGAKNMVGAFWQPRGVLIDVDVLSTLPDREYRAGLAEVVKYGVILDAEFFAYLEQNIAPINARDAAVLTRVIERCCRLKADVVEQDECEITGLRAILNYGHTFAHAFEAAGEYGLLLHGEAVAIGMECAARLAHSMGRIDEEFLRRQTALLTALYLPTAVPDFDCDELVRIMRRDKKVEEGRLRFVLPTKLGHVELVKDVRVDDVLKALKD